MEEYKIEYTRFTNEIHLERRTSCIWSNEKSYGSKDIQRARVK